MINLKSIYKELLGVNPLVSRLTLVEFLNIFEGTEKGQKGIFTQVSDMMWSIGKVEKKDYRRTPLEYKIPKIGQLVIPYTIALKLYVQSIALYRRNILTIEKFKAGVKDRKELIEGIELQNKLILESLKESLELIIDAKDIDGLKKVEERRIFRGAKFANNNGKYDWRLCDELKWVGILSGNIPKKHYDFFVDSICKSNISILDWILDIKKYQKKNPDFFILNSWFIVIHKLFNSCYKIKGEKPLEYTILKEVLLNEKIRFVYYGERFN